jgi:hypothetical protein
VTLPIADAAITQAIAALLPPSAPVSAVVLEAEEGNQFTVRAQLRRPSFLPPIPSHLTIERQPQFPGAPLFVVRCDGVAAIAGPLLRIFNVLPPWAQFDGRRISIDLAALAKMYGATAALASVTALTITTTAGRVILSVQATI